MKQNHYRPGRNLVVAAWLSGAVLAAGLGGPLIASHRHPVTAQVGRGASSTFGPLLLADGGFTVTMDYAALAPALSDRANQSVVRTLARVAVVDAVGRTVYAREFPNRATGNVFRAEQEGTAYEVVGESGAAIVIEAAEVKSGEPAVNPLGWMIALVKEGNGLRLAEPEIRFRGNLEHFPGPPLGPRHLVSGDWMRVREWTGYYSFIRAFRADFKAAVISATCARNCTLPVIVKAQPIIGGTPITLYSRPLGSAESVVLQVTSKVQYLDAYVADLARYDPRSDDEARRPWLHVLVDGREGWVTHTQDLAVLGLPYAP